jgi:hypothetical protein
MPCKQPENQAEGTSPRFTEFLLEIFKDGSEATLVPLLAGIGGGAGGGWYLAAQHLPKREYVLALAVCGYYLRACLWVRSRRCVVWVVRNGDQPGEHPDTIARATAKLSQRTLLWPWVRC